ncbi:unnamed protein product [Nesidiocoris tenuis]|uniref:Uncharacterized protein n=1 Tax=Nesidiocoris tenuis TaxID=355587 RepID=A0A6H5GI87_9HEMI|nr:unnamed protein product [Nesidiocoris tenuis]
MKVIKNRLNGKFNGIERSAALKKWIGIVQEEPSFQTAILDALPILPVWKFIHSLTSAHALWPTTASDTPSRRSFSNGKQFYSKRTFVYDRGLRTSARETLEAVHPRIPVPPSISRSHGT